MSRNPASSLADAASGALTWWVSELRGLVPQKASERRAKQPDATIKLAREGWIVHHRTGETAVLLPGDEPAHREAASGIKGRRKQGRVQLVVPIERCFSRRTVLPRRMLRRAATILASDLEIATPFGAGMTHWDWTVLGPGPEPGTVEVEQIVLKRRDTDPLVSSLAAEDITVLGIAVETADGRLAVDLTRHGALPDPNAASPDLHGPKRVLLWSATAAVLAIVPAAFSRQTATLAELDTAIAEATDAVALRPGLPRAPLQQLGDALTAKRDFPVTAVLDRLAVSLPPDCFLEHVFVEKDVVTIQGRSASLHDLERAFANTRLFTAGHNTAPADGEGPGQPFTLRLKMRPMPREAEA